MRQDAKELYLEARDYWSAGHADETEAAYRESIRLDPMLPHPHFDLAKLLEILGKDEAEIFNHYERFISLASGNPKLAPQVEQARQRVKILRSAKQASPSSPVAQQPVLPQVVHVSTPTLAQPPNLVLPDTRADAAKPGGVAVVFGIITMIISTLLLVASAIGLIAAMAGYESGVTSLGIAISCIPVLFFLFGILAGAVWAFGKGSIGKALAAIFWVILLVGVICGGFIFFLVLGGTSPF